MNLAAGKGILQEVLGIILQFLEENKILPKNENSTEIKPEILLLKF